MIIVVLFTILTVEVPSRGMSRATLIRMKKFHVSNIMSMDKLVILGIIKISFGIFYLSALKTGYTVSEYLMSLIIHGEKVSCFSQITSPQKFW